MSMKNAAKQGLARLKPMAGQACSRGKDWTGTRAWPWARSATLPRLSPVGQTLLVALPLLTVLLLLSKIFDCDYQLWVVFRLHGNAHEGLKNIERFITHWANYALYAVYLILFLRAWLGHARGCEDQTTMRRVLFFALVQLAISFLLVRVLKVCLGRPRPGVDGYYDFFSWAGSYGSLPSGHTAECAGAVIFLALWRQRILASIGLGLCLALVGFSRIYLGKHHLSDVFFGMLFGLYAGWLAHALRNSALAHRLTKPFMRRILRLRSPKPEPESGK